MGRKGKFNDGKVNGSVLWGCKGKCSDWKAKRSVVMGKFREK